MDKDEDNEHYDPNLPVFVSKTDWTPDCADGKIEGAYLKFQKTLPRRTTRSTPANNSDMCLNEHKKRDVLVIFPTDKNLGPYIISREDCIKQCLNERAPSQRRLLLLDDIRNGSGRTTLLKKQSHSLDSNLYYKRKDDLLYRAHTRSTSTDRSTYWTRPRRESHSSTESRKCTRTNQAYAQSRLVDRGWNFEKIKPIFKEAYERINHRKKKRKNKQKSNTKTIYLYTPSFTPRAIQRNQFRKIYDDTLARNTHIGSAYRCCLSP